MNALPGKSTMYNALLARDRSFDGVFWVGVKSTGIFCRPTCGARKPRLENCEFFPTSSSAMHSGFRPCKRCQPLDALAGSPPDWLVELRKTVEHEPWRRIKAADLREIGLNPDRVRQQFDKHFGMTFAAYQRAMAIGAAMMEIRNGQGVLEAGARAGFESTSGFRDAARRILGKPPSEASRKAALVCDRIESPLGPLLGMASPNGLCLLEFVDRRALEREIADLRRHFKSAVVPGTSEVISRTAVQLNEYFAGARTEFSIPLDAPGSTFQSKIWNALHGIAAGSTQSYASLADRVGRPGSARAVGRAVGSNRIAVIIPCHRVVGADGRLTGYGGGLWRKRWLLEHERSHQRTDSFREPAPQAAVLG